MKDRLDEGALHAANDLTESEYFSHPQLREAFCALEARYKNYFDASRDMRFVVARNGKIIDVNLAGVEMFSYASKEEMLELDSIGALYCDEDDRMLLQHKIEEDGFVKDYLVEVKRKDESTFLASITANLWA